MSRELGIEGQEQSYPGPARASANELEKQHGCQQHSLFLQSLDQLQGTATPGHTG